MPRQSFKDTINDWLESFSLSQLKNIPRRKNIYWKWFWFTAFVITLGAGIWKSYEEVQKYLDYPFDTYKRFVNSLETPFPAVTICNLNPMSQENGNYIRQVKELMTVYRYHLSLIAEKEAKNATAVEGATESNGNRIKRSLGFTTVTVTLPDVDQGLCLATTTTSTSTTSTSTTSTTMPQTELPTTTTTEVTTEQYTTAPSTTTSTTTEIFVPTTTVNPTTVPTTPYDPTTEVPSAIPSSTLPRKTTPDTSVTQATKTKVPSSETAKTQTEQKSTVKDTEFTSKNPAAAASTTSKDGDSFGQTTKPSASTEYRTTEQSFTEVETKGPTSTPLTVKPVITKESETAAPLTTKVTGKKDQTTKAENVEYTRSKARTSESLRTKPGIPEVQTSTKSESNELFTSTAETAEVPQREQTTVKTTKKSTDTDDASTPESKSTENASRGSSTVRQETKSVYNELVSDGPESSVSTSTNNGNTEDEALQSTTVNYPTKKSDFSISSSTKTVAAESKSTTFAEMRETATFTTQIPTKGQYIEHSSSSPKPSDMSTTTIATQLPGQSVKYASSSPESFDNSATNTAKTMTSSTATTPTTPFTSDPFELSSKSTTFSATTATIEDSKEFTTKSASDENETTKLGATPPSSTTINAKAISTPIPQTSSITTQTPTQEQVFEYSSLPVGPNDNSATTVTNQITGQTSNYLSSSVGQSDNSAASRSQQTTTFSETTTTMQTAKTAKAESKSTVFSSSTTTISSSSTQQPHPSTNKFGKASTTTVFTNTMPNEASETQKPSKSSIVNDKATSETNNQHASTSTTAYPNAQLTTADPIIFEGLKKSEIDELTDKFQIVSNSSRISLESQAQGRLLSMANNNQNSGYAVNDIIISCSFNMISCDLDKDFAKVSDPWFGNCYTFNYDGKHSIVGSGNKFGLKIIAFSNVSEYLATTSQAGMKVVVHKQNFDPFPNNEGIYASVGSHVNVNVRYKSLEQLTAPYGVCRHENDTAGYIYDGRYRIEGCYRSCFQQRIIDACQCADPRFPKPKGLNISFCDLSNQAGFTCYVRYLSTKGDFMHVKNCICPHGCTEPDYTLDVWPSKWPIKKNNFTTPKCWGNYSCTKIDCLKAYKDNAVAIDITHNYMFHRRTYEQASFSVMDLILEIAGNLGLWTGFSMLVLGEIFNIFFFFLYRPNVDGRVGDIEMSDMSNQNTSNIYDSANISEEYGNDVPRPIIHASSAGGLIQEVPSSNDNVSSESDFEDEDFDLKEPDSCAAFLVKPELLYDISKEFGDATDDNTTSEVKPRPLQGSKLVDRMYLELRKAGKIEPMCPVNFKKYHFAVPSNYNNETWNSGISQNVPSTDSVETETENFEVKDENHDKLIKPLLVRDLGFSDEDYNKRHGFPKSINPFPPIKGLVRTLADVPNDYKPYISNGRLCFPNSRKYYFPNEFQNDTSQSTLTKNADLNDDDETQSPSSSTKTHEKQS